MKDDVNNKTEILTMNGVEIMSDIVSFILSNTFKAPKLRVKSEDSERHRRKHSMSVIHEKNEDSVVHDAAKEIVDMLPPMSPKEAPIFESH